MNAHRIFWFSFVASCIATQSSSFPEQILSFCTSKRDANYIQISCKSDELIVVHEAFFATYSSRNNYCPFPMSKNELSKPSSTDMWETICKEDLRLAFNKRCSGLPNCTFSLKEEHNLKCLEDGYIVVRYTCIEERSLQRYCGLKFNSKFGYISTPGYPRFYPALFQCSWTFEAGDYGGRVKLTILDADIAPPKVVAVIKQKGYGNFLEKTKCIDSLRVYRDDNMILEACGNNLENLRTITESDYLNVTFNASNFAPNRGVLMRYSVEGCPTLEPPRKGHLAFRNESLVLYTCCANYVFEDTKLPTKYLYCLDGVHWNASLLKCIPIETVSTESTGSSTFLEQKSDVNDTYFSAIIVPVLVMCGLLIINAVIVWTILRFRKRQKIRERNETTVPLNSTQPANV